MNGKGKRRREKAASMRKLYRDFEAKYLSVWPEKRHFFEIMQLGGRMRKFRDAVVGSHFTVWF